MQPNGWSFSEEGLIAEVISKNFPAAWVEDFEMPKLHLETSIKDILSELAVIEEKINTHLKNNQDNPDKKNLKNPCRIHGTHKWDVTRIQRITRTMTKIKQIMTETNRIK